MIELPGLIYNMDETALRISIWHPDEDHRDSPVREFMKHLNDWGSIIGYGTRYAPPSEGKSRVEIKPGGDASSLGIEELVGEVSSSISSSWNVGKVLSPTQLKTVLGQQYTEFVSQYNAAIERS